MSKSEDVQRTILEKKPILQSTFSSIVEGNKQRQVRKILNSALKEYSAYKNGVGVFAAVGASILACNIITPLTRNFTANFYQKRKLQMQKIPVKNNNQVNMVYSNYLPISNTYNMFKI